MENYNTFVDSTSYMKVKMFGTLHESKNVWYKYMTVIVCNSNFIGLHPVIRWLESAKHFHRLSISEPDNIVIVIPHINHVVQISEVEDGDIER
jgi:hypothetical protein